MSLRLKIDTSDLSPGDTCKCPIASPTLPPPQLLSLPMDTRQLRSIYENDVYPTPSFRKIAMNSPRHCSYRTCYLYSLQSRCICFREMKVMVIQPCLVNAPRIIPLLCLFRRRHLHCLRYHGKWSRRTTVMGVYLLCLSALYQSSFLRNLQFLSQHLSQPHLPHLHKRVEELQKMSRLKKISVNHQTTAHLGLPRLTFF